MILPAHNAHLLQVQAPSTITDPSLDCTAGTGGVGAIKWAGDAQAAVRDTQVEEVHGTQRLTVRQLQVDLPSNLPVAVAENDVLTLRLLDHNELVTFEVRQYDKVFWGLGKYRYTCRQTVA